MTDWVSDLANDPEYRRAFRELHVLIDRARLAKGADGIKRQILGGVLHAISTHAPFIDGYRSFKHADGEVWLPDTVPAGEELVFIAKARILGERA